MDSSLLDVSTDIIGETPKKKPMSPKSFAKDIVERLAIVTPSGRVDAAEFLSSNTKCYPKQVIIFSVSKSFITGPKILY